MTEVKTHIADPCWMYAWMTTETDGKSWWSTYRTTLVNDEDSQNMWALKDLIGDGELLHREVIEDDTMLFGEGELSIYAPA